MTLPSSAMTSRTNRERRASGPPLVRAAAFDGLAAGASPRVWVTEGLLGRLLERAGGGVTPQAQGRQDSNLQQPVLETGTLPIELRPSRPAAPAHAGAGAYHPRSGSVRHGRVAAPTSRGRRARSDPRRRPFPRS